MCWKIKGNRKPSSSSDGRQYIVLNTPSVEAVADSSHPAKSSTLGCGRALLMTSSRSFSSDLKLKLLSTGAKDCRFLKAKKELMDFGQISYSTSHHLSQDANDAKMS